MDRTRLGRLAAGAALGAMLALLVWRDIVEGQDWRGAVVTTLCGAAIGCVVAYATRPK